MEPIQTKHTFRVDLDQCPVTAELPRPLSHSDALADEIVVAVRRMQSPVTLSAMTALATLTYATRQTLPIEGRVAGNCVIIPLPAAAYAVPGAFRLCVQLQSGDVRHTLLHLSGHMAATSTDALISSGDLLPTLPELLSRIDGMQEATTDARLAAAESRMAADTLTERVSTAMADMAAQVNLAAPSIMAEVSGAAAVCTDAAAREAVAVISAIDPVTDGTADPSTGALVTFTPVSAVTLSHGAEANTAMTTLSADLPEPIPGGRLNWTTGELTVTHALRPATDLVWQKSSKMEGRFVSPCSQTSIVACTHYPVGALNDAGVIFRSAPDQIGFNTDFATRDEWIAWLAEQDAAGTPVLICIELPPERQETLTIMPRQLTLLRGSNALWSTTGSTALTYVADTKLYIDNAVAALATAIINT